MTSTAADTGSGALDSQSAPLPVTPTVERRDHRVTAVLVAHNGERWLPRTLAALRSGGRVPDRLIAVDTGSSDRTAELLVAGGLGTADIVTLGPQAGFGQAVTAALEFADHNPADEPGSGDHPDAPLLDEAPGRDPEIVLDLTDSRAGASPDSASAEDPHTIDLRDERPTVDPGGTVEWVWLLHDDAAAAPSALAELLRRADELPSAEVLGPKLRNWRRPDVLQECGLALSGAGRPESGVTRGEVDQGQLDGRSDVMAVSSAGMLVRRDLWDRLAGFSPAFSGEGADTDFCWRARRAGARVVVAPRAVVFHRGAASDDRRDGDGRRGTARYDHRRTAVITALVHAPLWRVPFTVLRTALGGLLRCLLGLIVLAPQRAWDDLAGTVVGLLSWRRVASARRAAAATATIARRELSHLRPTLGQRMVRWQELLVLPGRRGLHTDVPGAESTERLGRPLVVVAAALGAVCLIAGWGLWFGSGRLAGGALLPAPDTTGDLLATFLSPWHEVGLGSDVAAPAYLAVLAAVSLLFLGSAAAAVQTLLLATPVFAGLSMMLALRGIVRRPVLVAAGLAYALVPATLAAVDTGRLGTAMAAVLLPPTARLLVRTSGFVTPLRPGNRRTLVAAALMTTTVAAFVPALALTMVAAATLACVFGRQGRGAAHMAVVAVSMVALLWPWSGALIADPGQLLLEIGAHPARLSVDPAPVWQLGLLNPGGATAAPGFVAVSLAVLAVLALVPGRTRRAVVAAWLVILAGLMLALAQALATVSVSWTDQPVSPWPGPGTLLMALGAVTAAGIAATALSMRWFSGRLAVAALLIAPTLAASWWLVQGDSLVRREDPTVVSPFVSVASLGPLAPRSLALQQRPDGSVSYQLLSGAGPRLGDADVAPAIASVADFSSAVARMAAGSGAAADEVAQASVQFVTVAVDRDRGLARQLDAVPGLRRVSTIDGQGLWEIAEPVARVRAIGPSGPAVPLAADVARPGLTAAGPLPADAVQVQISDQPSDVWRASVSGADLTAVPGAWQTFEVPSGAAGEVSVSTDPTRRLLALLVPAFAALILVGAAMRSGTAPPPTRVVDAPPSRMEPELEVAP